MVRRAFRPTGTGSLCGPPTLGISLLPIDFPVWDVWPTPDGETLADGVLRDHLWVAELQQVVRTPAFEPTPDRPLPPKG